MIAARYACPCSGILPRHLIVQGLLRLVRLATRPIRDLPGLPDFLEFGLVGIIGLRDFILGRQRVFLGLARELDRKSVV